MLKAGLIGLGRMGLTHLSILKSHPAVLFVGVCDASRFLLNNLAGRLDVRAFRDYRKMLDECDLDFVLVATPPQSHAEIARYAISKNVHLFVEKPLTPSATESREIVEQLRRTRLVNQVGYVNRFNPVFAEVKKLLEEGLLGTIRHLRSEMYGRTVLKDSKGAWRTQRKHGGGCLYEFGSHCIDLVHFLIGPPERVVGSVLQNVYSSQAEDAVYSTFLYDGGVSATIHVNWSDASHRKPTNRIEVFGTNGKLTADKHAYKLFLRHADGSGRFREGWNVRYVTDLCKPVRFYVRGNEFTEQLDHFVECVRNGEGNGNGACTCQDALNTDVVIEQIIRDSQCGERTSG